MELQSRKPKRPVQRSETKCAFHNILLPYIQVLTVFCMVSSFKFASRSATLATDGFIVYDIQDEGGRTTTERPFPFRFVDNAFQILLALSVFLTLWDD